MASRVRKQVRSPDTTTGPLTTKISAIPELWSGTAKIYCFENPQVDLTRSDRVDWKISTGPRIRYHCRFMCTWERLLRNVTGARAPQNIRRPASSAAVTASEGCFAPGVKITMADGSLRNIEDVRAGDMVRNAKTGAPVKVGKVIEGPEALPLIRFGFDGTTVTTSQAHPVLTAAGLKPANELKKGDTVFDAQGNPAPRHDPRNTPDRGGTKSHQCQSGGGVL